MRDGVRDGVGVWVLRVRVRVHIAASTTRGYSLRCAHLTLRCIDLILRGTHTPQLAESNTPLLYSWKVDWYAAIPTATWC